MIMKNEVYNFENRKLTVPISWHRHAVTTAKGGDGSRLRRMITRMLKSSRKIDKNVEQMRLEGL